MRGRGFDIAMMGVAAVGVALLLLGATQVRGESFWFVNSDHWFAGRVVRNHDGDSMRVLVSANNRMDHLQDREVSVRIFGIDTPELKQTCETKPSGGMLGLFGGSTSRVDCGAIATKVLNGLVASGTVRCYPLGVSYERQVAQCWVPNGDGSHTDVALYMVRAGMAYATQCSGKKVPDTNQRIPCKSDTERRLMGLYMEEQKAARDKGVGLWQYNFQRPDHFRKQ